MTTTSQPAPQQWFHGPAPSPAPGPHWGPPPQGWVAAPAPRQRKVWPWLVAGVVVLALVVAGIVGAAGLRTVELRGEVLGTSSVSPTTLSIAELTGALDQFSAFYPAEGGECAGYGGYQDIRGGAVVTVHDADGRLVGTGQLQPGVGEAGECRFAFAIPDVPAGDFYQVEVAQRGQLPYTAAEVEQGIRMDIGP